MNINEWTGSEYPEHIIDQAAGWLGFLDGYVNTHTLKGEDSTTEILEQSIHKLDHSKRLEFFEWLGQDPRHQYIFADCCEMWAKTSCLKSLKSSVQSSNLVLLAPRHQSKPKFQISSLVGESYSHNQCAPVWAYNVVIGLIVVGLSLPIFS